jgi:hypothetical protein
MSPRVLATVAIGLMCVGVLSSCSDADHSCAGPEVTTPAAAHPGQTLQVPVANLRSSCLDQAGPGAAPASDTVTLQLVDGDTREAVATATADVGTDAAVVVKITVPKDASGTLEFVLDGDEVASLQVVPRP